MDINLIVLTTMFPKKYAPQSGTFVYEQVRALRSLIKGEITVIVPVPWAPRLLWFKKKWREYGSTERENVIDGIKIYFKKHLVIPGKIYFHFESLFIYLSCLSLVKRLVKAKERRTILHTHTLLPTGLSGVLLAKKFKIPHICTVHGSDINIFPFYSKLSLALTKYALKKCDQIVVVSSKLKEKMLSIEKGLKRISLIHNGADSRRFYPMPKGTAKQKLGINEANKIILFIGNLIPVKGVNYLIEAFAKLQQFYKSTETSLYLIGDGSERKNLESLARKLNISEKVIFLGKKLHAEIPLWLNVADVFILPSVSEGFPTVIPEAMMCGVPVIVSNVGGVSEIINDGVTGFLTKPRDVEGIREKIILLLENEISRNKIITAAMKKAANYTWTNNAIESVRGYKKVLYQ